MVTILDELIKELKSHNFTVKIADIRDFYSTKKPKYPMIAIEEVVNMPTLQILGKEKISNISYKFEIYTRDMLINSKVETKRVASDLICGELDEFLKSKYGFKRSTSPVKIPYGTDETILRTVMVYNAKIDNDTMIMYQ